MHSYPGELGLPSSRWEERKRDQKDQSLAGIPVALHLFHSSEALTLLVSFVCDLLSREARSRQLFCRRAMFG